MYPDSAEVATRLISRRVNRLAIRSRDLVAFGISMHGVAFQSITAFADSHFLCKTVKRHESNRPLSLTDSNCNLVNPAMAKKDKKNKKKQAGDW